MRALRYAFDEALSSLWRGRTSGLLSTVTIAVALFVLGAFLVLTSNLERLGSEWSSAAEMSVYLDDDATPRRGHGRRVSRPDEIVVGLQVRVEGRGPDAIQADVRRPRGCGRDARRKPAAGLLRGAAAGGCRRTGGRSSSWPRGCGRLPGVVDVRYDRQWLDRLLAAVAVLRGVGLVLGAFLTVAAALTVANVVRLALYARRDELEIMRLVGAPPVYIRGPFVMEGVLQGGIGAAAALAALAAVFLAVRARYLVPLAGAVNLSSVRFLPLDLCLLLLVGGTLVGCFGGLIASAGEKG